MPRQLGPHRPGVPAYETLRDAASRLVDAVGGSVHPRALDVMIDDALAPEVMVGERVDTVMLSSHVFGLDGARLLASPTSTGRPGLLAFTERRIIAAHAEGIVRVRRTVEAFPLDGDTRFRAVTPTVAGRQVRMFEIANAQGWHRLFLPDATEVDAAVLDGWDRHVAARLVGALAPRWEGTELAGWERGNPTVPTRRPPEALAVDGDDHDAIASLDADVVDGSGPLPAVDLTRGVRWWER